MLDLRISLGDETGFETWVWSFRVFDFESEFGSNDFAIAGTRNDGIGAMFEDGSEFFFNS
jgi:hypothetical protein